MGKFSHQPNGLKEKHDKGNFNHGSPERVEAITICLILIHGWHQSPRLTFNKYGLAYSMRSSGISINLRCLSSDPQYPINPTASLPSKP
jgi:hypothetical protein